MKTSPDPEIDWSNKKEVLSYNNLFDRWSTVLRGSDRSTKELYEIKDGLILKDGEYYLPYKYSFDLGYATADFPEDGFVIACCFKKNNRWYSIEGGPIVNIYSITSRVDESFLTNLELREKLKNGPVLDYLRAIDTRYLTSKDLDLYRKHLPDLLQEFTPYTYKAEKPVRFYCTKCTILSNLSITISHRNRSGRIKVDNGYRGRYYKSLDYYLILKANPDFTNETGYAGRVEGNIVFDQTLFENLAPQVISKWDAAIENNARYFG